MGYGGNMSRDFYYLIKLEYEKRQKDAADRLESRKKELYSKIPRLEEIDNEINLSGIKYSRLILQGNSQDVDAVKKVQEIIDGLKEEKNSLLLSHGYPEDYLEPVYKCPQCRDTGYIESENRIEKCHCYKQLLIEFLYKESGLGPVERGNFSQFDESFFSDEVNVEKYGINISPRENILLIKEKCMEFIENFHKPEQKNLFFSGPAGVGKTYMANCIAEELINRGITVLYMTSPKLFSTINEYKARALKEEEYDDLSYRNIFESELLIIDDLGTEPMSAARYAEFLSLLNARLSRDMSSPCKTIISTNFGIKELYEYYDERVASRIIGAFEIYRFAGDDIRRLKKLGAK